MRRFFVVLTCVVLSGCTLLTGPKQIDPGKRVNTLGVLPVLVDVETIPYSNRDGLVALLEESSRDVDKWLIERLRKKGDYFDVRRVDVPAAQAFGQIIASRIRVEEKEGHRYRYTFDPDGVAALANDHLVDAVLVVVINGITRPEKRWSEYASRLEFLETEYDSLLYTAAVVAPADILWTRPVPAGDFFLRLDYPDFLEAFWNRTDVVTVKEITLPGLQRTLAEMEEGLFVQSTIPKRYNQMVRELVEHLKTGM